AIAATEADGVESHMQIALDRVCAYTGWPVGHVYTVAAGKAHLIPTALWHLDDPERYEVFQTVSQSMILAVGEGLPGRVAEAAKPAWVMDVKHDTNFPRAKAAMDLGVTAGFAFPVL